MNIFKDLTIEEEKEFRQWARSHPEELINFESKRLIWHPIVIDEYRKMKKEIETLSV